MTYDVQTATRTNTYTLVDVRKAFEGVEADLRMLARRTEARDQKWAEDVAHDILELARGEYLERVDVMFFDRNGVERRARRYTPEAGVVRDGQRPGENGWPTDRLGRLSTVLTYTKKWWRLTDAQRDAYRRRLRINWSPSKIDTSHSSLRRTGGRTYASSGYAVERTDWEE
jgi:hypothetical protein